MAGEISNKSAYRKAWLKAGLVVLPVVYTAAALSSNLGYAPPIPVYMLPPFFLFGVLGFPSAIALMLSTLPVAGLYVLALYHIEKKWLFAIQFILLASSGTMMVACWNDGVVNEGVMYMASVAAVQAFGSAAYVALVYACYRTRAGKLCYVANLVFFLMLACCLFPAAVIPREPSVLYFG